MRPTTGERLTIFHLDDERGFRGGERQLMYLASALRARGHENVVCCRGGSPLEREARREGFAVLVLPFAFEFDLRSARLLAREAQRRSGPVVHAHTGHTVGIAAACRLFGGPAAIAHRRGASRLRGGFSRWLKYDRVARVVAVSHAIEEILTRGGLAQVHIAVVPDCVPVSCEEWHDAGYGSPRFAPSSPERRSRARRALADAFGLDASASWVGTLAALVPLKDHATLIAAAASVVRQKPDTVFLLAGEGPERERLQADIESRGLTGRIVLLGHYDASELFAAIDLFVLSSSREGMGSVLLEAAACGIPVAATAVGGIPEVVRDGLTGLLVPPRDHLALAGAISRLLEQPGLASRLSAAAREALPRFGLEAMVRQMETIYAAAAAPARQSAPALATRSAIADLLAGPRVAGPPSGWPGWPSVVTKQFRRQTLLALVASAVIVTDSAPLWMANSMRDTPRPNQPTAQGPDRGRVASPHATGRHGSLGLDTDFRDLSDEQMLALLRAVDSLPSLPSANPDESSSLVGALPGAATPDTRR